MLKERRRHASLLNWLTLDRAASTPLYKQISDQIRDAIATGRLAPSAYLPASRALAFDLGVSRVTTTQAYDLLIAEGFLETRKGSGTRVAQKLAGNPLKRVVEGRRRLAGETLPAEDHSAHTVYWQEPAALPFRPGVPALDAFPHLLWSQLLRRHALRRERFILDYAHVGGYGPLRQEIAKYLGSSRGVTCTSEQVIVTTTVAAAIGALCAVLLPPGSGIVLEDPGYVFARLRFQEAGLQIHYAPVDAQGLRIDCPAFQQEGCLATYVTPAHQWPTECTLSATRRLELLDWASRRGAWILEDDYDSEFRFASPPIATLHSLARGERVVYFGTFSKTLAPSLRCAYLAVPAAHASEFERAVYHRGIEPALHVQAALSEFLSEGHFVRHIARMRKLYRRRRDLLSSALQDAFGDRIRVVLPPGGLQVIAELPPDVSAASASRRAADADLLARDLAEYAAVHPAPNALHLGFGVLPDKEIQPAVIRLKGALSSLL